MEKVLTISLSEYEKLTQQLDEFKKAQKNKDCILVENNIGYYNMGGYYGSVKLFTKDELITSLHDINKQVLKEKEAQSTRIRELLDENTTLKYTKKSFW